jgi:hypothetical protein
MTQRLGGWQRLGIVISLCRVVGSLVGVRSYQYHNGLDAANASVGLCTTAGKPFDQCWNENTDFRRTMTEPYWPPVFMVALGPIPLFWLFGWAIIKTARWVRAGFAA